MNSAELSFNVSTAADFSKINQNCPSHNNTEIKAPLFWDLATPGAAAEISRISATFALSIIIWNDFELKICEISSYYGRKFVPQG